MIFFFKQRCVYIGNRYADSIIGKQRRKKTVIGTVRYGTVRIRGQPIRGYVLKKNRI
jgi:hypothetical protein